MGLPSAGPKNIPSLGKAMISMVVTHRCGKHGGSIGIYEEGRARLQDGRFGDPTEQKTVGGH